jgi:hypothetical protein
MLNLKILTSKCLSIICGALPTYLYARARGVHRVLESVFPDGKTLTSRAHARGATQKNSSQAGKNFLPSRAHARIAPPAPNLPCSACKIAPFRALDENTPHYAFCACEGK